MKKINRWTYLFVPIILIFPIVGIAGVIVFGDPLMMIPLSCFFSLPALVGWMHIRFIEGVKK